MRTTLILLFQIAALSSALAGPVHGDVEIDPTAYALAGHSLHVGIEHAHLRVDLGNFGLTEPALLTGQDAFDVRFTGYGAKLQYFPGAEPRGWFAGISAASITLDLHHRASGLAADDHYVSVGVDAGYRIALPAGFYVTPWLGVSYNFGADDQILAGERYKASRIHVFPAVHLGYRFP